MAWENSDFIKHFYTGNARKVTLVEAGHAVAVKELIDKIVVDRSGGLKDQIRDEARKIKTGPVKYTTRNTYDFKDILFAFGSSSVATTFVGTCTEEHGLYRLEGNIKINYIDDFTDVIRLIEKVFGTSHPKNLPDWLKKLMNLGGDSYPIVGEWVEEFTDDFE